MVFCFLFYQTESVVGKQCLNKCCLFTDTVLEECESLSNWNEILSMNHNSQGSLTSPNIQSAQYFLPQILSVFFLHASSFIARDGCLFCFRVSHQPETLCLCLLRRQRCSGGSDGCHLALLPPSYCSPGVISRTAVAFFVALPFFLLSTSQLSATISPSREEDIVRHGFM